MNMDERREVLAEILKYRGLADELCECGCFRSAHVNVGSAIGHGHCELCDCEKYRWVPGGVPVEE